MSADPWALLREAQKLCAHVVARKGGSFGSMAEVVEYAEKVLPSIDAALAERQDSAKDVVESEVEWDRVNAHFYTAYPDDETNLIVCRFDLTRQEWRWDMEREVKRKGYCATEAEAKSAAITAARGME